MEENKQVSTELKKPNPNRRTNNRPNPNANKSKNPNKSNKNKRNYGRNKTAPIDKTLKENVYKNQKVHISRLNPHYKLNLDSTEKVRITPLGGLGEIGGNITVFETEKEAILVDIGMSFPDETMHGVDILVPDFSYLKLIKDKIVAFVITHAHEDHIGAVPYLFKELQMPIYATALPLAMIGNKFDEHHISKHRNYFRPIVKGSPVVISDDFEVEWMHMTHSIIDNSTLAITTKSGTIIHTGDFKFDHTPVDGYPADLHRLAYYGAKGVMCMLSDSTNSHNVGMTASELSVRPGLENVFNGKKGRVFISTFSSNIHRVFQAIEIGIAQGRKVCVIGRSMERNLELALGYDYIRLPKDSFIEADELSRYDDDKILIVTTGSQGESNSALFRMAIGEHRMIKIKPGDSIILSARAIPGNESSISRVINHLQKAGASVVYGNSNIHVSGHAAQEEQILMLRLIQPKFFLPIHGEYNHISRHKQTAISCGVPERNIVLMQDGDQIEVTPRYMRKVKTVKSGKTYIDNQNNYQIEDDIIIDRQKLANDGIVNLVAIVSKDDNHMASKPKVSSFGLVADKQDKIFAKEMEGVLEQFLVNVRDGLIENPRALGNDLRQVIRKHIYRKMKKYPLIVPHVFVQ
jgi:ribonuclease J